MYCFKISRGGYVSKYCLVPNVTDQGYYYITLADGRGVKRIWVSRKAITIRDGKEVIIDWLNYRKTEKGNVVLLPNDNKNETIVVIEATCGYRGTSTITIEDGEIIERGAFYHSPRGSLGVSDVVLAKVKDGAKVIASRTGRLYGADSTIVAKIVFGGEGIEMILAPEKEDEALFELL